MEGAILEKEAREDLFEELGLSRELNKVNKVTSHEDLGKVDSMWRDWQVQKPCDRLSLVCVCVYARNSKSSSRITEKEGKK